ncbi:MAG TPA: hypothetical protein VFX35_05030 [Solirubrobacterales bacterium]|nr:hypothetical protein [Solirubrobacterales bacterium]
MAVFAGCGSGDSTNAAAEEAAAPLTKAEFVKQAEQICTKGLKEKEQAVSAALKKGAGSNPKEIEKLVEETILPSYGSIVEQLGELGVPEEGKAEVEKMVSDFESALSTVESEPVKSTKKDPFDAVDKAAAAYGIETCSL